MWPESGASPSSVHPPWSKPICQREKNLHRLKPSSGGTDWSGPWAVLPRVRHLTQGEGLPGELVRFGIVGSAGFATDATILSVLVYVFDWNPYYARLISFLTGTALTWVLNRVFTFFRRAGPNRVREYLRYLAVQIVGGTVNLGAYTAMLSVSTLAQRYLLIALAAGSGTAMFVNFLGSRSIAFDRGGRVCTNRAS
jgi:putative flippase GtrA